MINTSRTTISRAKRKEFCETTMASEDKKYIRGFKHFTGNNEAGKWGNYTNAKIA